MRFYPQIDDPVMLAGGLAELPSQYEPPPEPLQPGQRLPPTIDWALRLTFQQMEDLAFENNLLKPARYNNVEPYTAEDDEWKTTVLDFCSMLIPGPPRSCKGVRYVCIGREGEENSVTPAIVFYTNYTPVEERVLTEEEEEFCEMVGVEPRWYTDCRRDFWMDDEGGG